MALTERDGNQTVARKQDGKRKRVKIDLSSDGDSDDLDAPLKRRRRTLSSRVAATYLQHTRRHLRAAHSDHPSIPTTIAEAMNQSTAPPA